jgi:hypothetical protein
MGRSRASGSREYRRHPLLTLALLAVAVTLVALTLGAVGAAPASAATFHRCSGKVKLDGGGTATHIKVRRVSCRRARHLLKLPQTKVCQTRRGIRRCHKTFGMTDRGYVCDATGLFPGYVKVLCEKPGTRRAIKFRARGVGSPR